MLELTFPTSGVSPLEGHYLFFEVGDLTFMISIEVWQVEKQNSQERSTLSIAKVVGQRAPRSVPSDNAKRVIKTFTQF